MIYFITHFIKIISEKLQNKQTKKPPLYRCAKPFPKCGFLIDIEINAQFFDDSLDYLISVTYVVWNFWLG